MDSKWIGCHVSKVICLHKKSRGLVSHGYHRQWGGKTIECQSSMAKLILQVLRLSLYYYFFIFIYKSEVLRLSLIANDQVDGGVFVMKSSTPHWQFNFRCKTKLSMNSISIRQVRISYMRAR